MRPNICAGTLGMSLMRLSSAAFVGLTDTSAPLSERKIGPSSLPFSPSSMFIEVDSSAIAHSAKKLAPTTASAVHTMSKSREHGVRPDRLGPRFSWYALAMERTCDSENPASAFCVCSDEIWSIRASSDALTLPFSAWITGDAFPFSTAKWTPGERGTPGLVVPGKNA